MYVVWRYLDKVWYCGVYVMLIGSGVVGACIVAPSVGVGYSRCPRSRYDCVAYDVGIRCM